MTAITPSRRRLAVLIPVLDEWKCVALVIQALSQSLAPLDWEVSVLLVDDGSIAAPPPDLVSSDMSALGRIEILRLRRNLGHQRAIAIGLAFLEARREHDAVVIMDGDGEDSPADVPKLLSRFDQLDGRRVVFAARLKRSEGITFRLGYFAYRILHRALTGLPVRVGNFSILPAGAVSQLVAVSDLWNHYAASVFKARIPCDLIPLARVPRLSGTSTMSYTALIAHGLSAISVFGERVGVRGMILAGIMLLLTTGALGAVVMIRILTDWAIPGWASLLGGMLAVLTVQLLASVTIFSFVVLASRDSLSFLPSRDYAHFVQGIVRIDAGERSSTTLPAGS
jgi:polyisoprenyl-phosphate glycosyltransferase